MHMLQNMCDSATDNDNCQGETESSAERGYWEPAESVNELYKQLNSKKYREIVRQQVK